MPPKVQGYILLMVIMLILLLGVFMLIGLRVLRTRWLGRDTTDRLSRDARPNQPDIDPWEASGKRLFGGSENHTVFDDPPDDEGEPWNDDDDDEFV